MVQIVQGMAQEGTLYGILGATCGCLASCQARNMDYGLAYRAGCPLALAWCPSGSVDAFEDPGADLC